MALETLHKSKSIPTRVFLPPTHVAAGTPSSVTAETPAYFIEERVRTTKRNSIKEKVQDSSKFTTDPIMQARASRRLHCAVSDAQLYYCDRHPAKSRSPGADAANWLSLQAHNIEAAEARDQHVSAVVAEQQRREIEREKRIHQTYNTAHMDTVASVAMERYEAADQLMRILDVTSSICTPQSHCVRVGLRSHQVERVSGVFEEESGAADDAAAVHPVTTAAFLKSPCPTDIYGYPSFFRKSHEFPTTDRESKMARTSARIKAAEAAQRTKVERDRVEEASRKIVNKHPTKVNAAKGATKVAPRDVAKTPTKEVNMIEDDTSEETDEDPSGMAMESTHISSNDKDEISAYERQRLANIARNKELMVQIGLADVSSEMKVRRSSLAEQREESRKRRKEGLDALPRRQSRRVQGKDAEFSPAFNLPIVVAANNNDDDNSDDDEEAASWETLASDAKQHLGAFYRGLSNESSVIESSTAAATKYSIDARDVVKALPSRIYSLAFHHAISGTPASLTNLSIPTIASSTMLAGIADVEGNFALWTPPVDRSSDVESGLTAFRLHKRAISMLHFQDTSLLSSCMGGIVKRLDLGAADPSAACVVVELDAAITSFHVNYALSCMLLSCDDGSVVQTDLRQHSKKQQQSYTLHAKKINTVHCHPTEPKYDRFSAHDQGMTSFRSVFVTASLDRSIKLWDIRKLKASLAEMTHGKSVNCASFAPDGKTVVSVCLDNFVYLHNTSSIVATLPSPQKIKHDNHSGQWLTKFHAAWVCLSCLPWFSILSETHPQDPKKLTDCEFVLGGNKRPRCIDIFGTTSPKPRQMLSDDSLFTSVHSLNVFHPVLPVILGGNSSGRISMWRAQS
ncbi:hypothetical protein DYB32_005106 [Aphanomyces invadans]|uniref:Uncharacterized protein n=1 Tax=Aphanomyces invadans TaxID=157072 RepID=A0A418AVI1_9STRA|nr:hypothetical protein DYB32_005106 [Aphanomyces invadans]